MTNLDPNGFELCFELIKMLLHLHHNHILIVQFALQR